MRFCLPAAEPPRLPAHALAPELGYGKAVHHIMTRRRIGEHTRRFGRPPTPRQLDRLFDDDFFLPAASKPAHRQLKKSARRLVDTYLEKYEEDLQRVWEVERPFELHLPTAIISGRADVILDKEGGEVRSLAIVDYKTSTDAETTTTELQLAVYTDAEARPRRPRRSRRVRARPGGRRSATR